MSYSVFNRIEDAYFGLSKSHKTPFVVMCAATKPSQLVMNSGIVRELLRVISIIPVAIE